MPRGAHLIAGSWIPTAPSGLAGGSVVDAALPLAEAALPAFRALGPEARADFLDRIAVEIAARSDQITGRAAQETGLPLARLQVECRFTCAQLRRFADHIRQPGGPDPAGPDLKPIPRPIGPVAVFGAAELPLALSTAGADTVSALAAGCPVVVIGHPAHPATAEAVAGAVLAAIRACGLPPGIFTLLQGDAGDLGAALVQHPLIRAVGFAGSAARGRALSALCAARPVPIPFFGMAGSINPVFVLPAALAARGAEIARDWATSLTDSAGQHGVKPGVLVLIDGPDADAFAAAAGAALARMPPQPLLSAGIAAGFHAGAARVAHGAGVAGIVTARAPRPALGAGHSVLPQLYEVSAADFLSDPALAEAVFGPLGLIIRARHAADLLDLARALPGQPISTLQCDDPDLALAGCLMPLLEGRAGRILANDFPTAAAPPAVLMPDGPWPASIACGATRLGTLATRRWLRPVSTRNLPSALLPPDPA